MKNLKWMAIVALGAGAVFQLANCGTLGTLAAVLAGYSLLNGTGT